MRALLIDPSEGKQTVTVVEHSGGLQAIYDLLGCTNIEAPISYDNGDAMYIDGEVWLHFHEQEPEDEILMGGFMFDNWAYPIFGKALIVGTGEEGEDAPAKSREDEFWGIQWKDYNQMMDFGMRAGLV